MKLRQRLFWPIFFSFLIHLFIFNSFITIVKKFGSLKTIHSSRARPLKVKTISQQQLKKYRQTVGIKGGTKSFQASLPQGQNRKKARLKDIQTRHPLKRALNQKKSSPLALSSLTPKAQKIQKPKQSIFKPSYKKKYLKKKNSESLNIVPLQETHETPRKRQANLQRDILKNLAPNSQDAQILKNSGFNVRFEPPEGISEDKLNTAEKIYYSFQKRTFISYVNSFLKTYQRLLLKKPTIQKPLQEKRHLLSGRIIFDSKGNVVSIKIFQSSSNDDVHLLFEETLTQIGKLPNPPKDLVKNDGQFTIYYQMTINNR